MEQKPDKNMLDSAHDELKEAQNYYGLKKYNDSVFHASKAMELLLKARFKVKQNDRVEVSKLIERCRADDRLADYVQDLEYINPNRNLVAHQPVTLSERKTHRILDTANEIFSD